MMLAKCANGHFYDADTYNSCPHCKSEISDDLEFESIDVDYNEDNVLENNYNFFDFFEEEEYFNKKIKDLNRWAYIQNIKEELLKISHENIVSVYDIYTGEDGGNYIKESYVKGYTVEYLIASKMIALEDFLNIGIDICNAIKYLNSNKLIYMDIKSSNILYDVKEKKTVLIDIESIYNKKESTKIEYFGTIEYSSPEQILQSKYSIDGSIYSLGLVFYKILMGDLPFNVSKNGIIKKLKNELDLDFSESADFQYKTKIIKLIREMTLLKPQNRIKINKIIQLLKKIKKNASEIELHQNINSKREYISQEGWTKTGFENDVTISIGSILTETKSKKETRKNEHGFDLTYRDELLKEYSNILNQAKITFWCWISSLVMCYIIIGVCIFLVLEKRFVDSICSGLLEGLIYAVQNIFSIREDHYRELINSKLLHLEKGDFFEYATSKAEILTDNNKKEGVVIKIIDDIRKEAIK